MLRSHRDLGARAPGAKVFASLFGLLLVLLGVATNARAEDDEDFRPVVSATQYAADAATPGVLTVTQDVYHDVLPTLRGTPVLPFYGPKGFHFEGLIPLPPGSENQTDGAVQGPAHGPLAPTPPLISTVQGVGNSGPGGSSWITGTPPDTNGAVGSTQYVQSVNGSLVVLDKATKAVVYGPVFNNTLWNGISAGQCGTRNDGDPVVAYDKAADRWVITQFSVPSNSGPDWQCVAVSQTNDATGSWNRYVFQYAGFNDYGKLGVWPDAYYMTFNMFGAESGAKLCAFDRNAMLAGATATQQCFQLANSIGGVLPSDLDGSTPPPAGSPDYLLNFGTNSLNLWKFHVDWANTANTTLTGPVSISVASFSAACGGNACIPQHSVPHPAKAATLDSLADRLMFRLAYRNFGDHESLVVSHSVTAGAGSAVRWYEIRSPGTTPVVYQQSTYSPDNTLYRWMPSIAMDQNGNIALGYSTSSSTTYPSIAYTGRLVTDTLSTMGAEVQMAAGTGSETYNRWGDYSAMTIDPVDDCTFWYTNEYVLTTGEFTWDTSIGSFKFPGCGGGKTNQTITFPNPGPVTYSPSGTFALGAIASSGLPVTYTSNTTGICTVSGSTVTIVTAGTCSISANQAGNATYNPAPTVTDLITISKASQTITFPNPGPVTYSAGGTFALGATASSGLTVSYTSSTTGVCTVSASIVTIVAAGTCTIKADQGGNTNYNAAPQVSDDITISKAGQTISFTTSVPAAATVGGATYTPAATSTSSLGVALTIDALASSVCSMSAGVVSFQTIGTCIIDANQGGNANYNPAAQVQQSFTVGKGSQTITFPNPGPVTYSASGTFALGATASSGLTVSYTSTTTGVCTVSGNTATIVTAGTCTIKADQAGDSNYNAAPQVSDDIAISKAGQTITFPNPGPVTYSASGTFALGATASSGLTVSYTSTTTGVCTVSGNTATIVTAGTCTIKADQAGNTNYNAAPQVSDDITISKAGQTITFPNPGPVTYSVGGTIPLGATASSGLTVSYTSSTTGVCTVSAGTVTIVTAGTCTIKADQAGNTNYNAAPQVSDDITISKAGQTITFPNPGPVTYSSGGTIPLGATASSGLTVSYTSSTTGVCTVSAGTVTIVTAGTCTIKADQAGNTNYNAASQVSDDITISKAGQTITFPNPGPVTYSVGGTFPLGATASSGLTVSYTSTTTGVCTVSGSTATIVSAGTCTIKADQAGNTNYNPAPQVSDDITISKAGQTITFPNPGPVTYSAGGTFALGATASSGLAVSYTSTTTGVCTVSGSTATIVSAGTCTIKADQAGNTNYNAAPQVSNDITISKAGQTITFPNPGPVTYSAGGTFALGATASSGLAVSYTSTTTGVCTVSGSTATIVTAGTCTIKADQGGDSNYNAAPQVSDDITISKAGQTITFPNPGPVTYSVGGTFPLGATASSGLTVSYTSTTTGVCTVSGSTATIVSAGTCTIKADQAGNTNYNAAPQVSDDVTIGKASQTINFTSLAPGSATVGGATYNVTATGGASGNPVTFAIDGSASSVCSISGAAVSFVGAGTCVIDANQAGNGNYNVAPQTHQSFGVGKANQTIAFPNPAPQTYSVGGTFPLGATASSGLTVSYTSTTTGVCTVSGSTATIVTAGTCTIKADQAGNTNYNAAPQVSDDITISKASQTITFTSVPSGSASVGGATYNVTATGGASGNTVTFTIHATASSVCSISGSTVSFIGSGTCVIDANQAGNANYNVAPQAQQSFAVSAGALTLVFTQSPASLNQGDMLGNVQVTEKDSLGNVIPASGTVDFTVATACGTVDLGTAPMSGGVATLNSSQRFYTATSSRQIAATSTTLSATSTAFAVLASGVLFADGFECHP